MNIFLVFRVRIIAALAITVLCSGCGLILVGAILALPKNVAAGHAEVPANSSVALYTSMQPEATNRFYYISGSVYSFVPLEQGWNGGLKWSIVRYNSSLQPLDSFEFAVRYKETPISLFRCGDRLLLLSTSLDNDSLNLLGRWFDISAKPLSDEATLIRDNSQKGPYTILPSPDSSHFLVRNAHYRKDATIDVVLKVFNSRLELLQSRVVSRASGKQELKMVQVDNAGALYTVQSVEKEGLLVQRSLPDGTTLDISIPIALSHKDSTEPPTVNSAFLVPESGDKSYLFSTVQAMGLVGMKKITLHSCNWKTGKAEVVNNYMTDERVARKVSSDSAMGRFRLQNVYSTPQGFLVWAEQLADTLGDYYRSKLLCEPQVMYGGTTGLFAFDKKGNLLWQRGFTQKKFIGVNPQGGRNSYLCVVNDTLCVLKYNTADVYNASKKIESRTQLMLNRVALSTGEAGAPIPILDLVGAVMISNDELWCIDKRNILMRCYELNVPATRLMYLRL